MAKICVVTDSCADLSNEQAHEHGITVVPLSVIFGDKVYLDGIELESDQFFEMLTAAEKLPTTSQPTPAEFIAVYTKLFNQGCDTIISVHLSAHLSGTLESARQAVEEMGKDIRLVDSKAISVGVGIAAISAAEAVKAGKTADEVVAIVENTCKNLECLFTLDTLKYLEKGGRIGKARS
ncbi:MAG: DegV family protein, partial [bacterium]|nr:DegV family protein [bacterium]